MRTKTITRLEGGGLNRTFKSLREAFKFLRSIGAKGVKGFSGKSKDASYKRYTFKVFKTFNMVLRLTVKETY